MKSCKWRLDGRRSQKEYCGAVEEEEEGGGKRTVSGLIALPGGSVPTALGSIAIGAVRYHVPNQRKEGRKEERKEGRMDGWKTERCLYRWKSIERWLAKEKAQSKRCTPDSEGSGQPERKSLRKGTKDEERERQREVEREGRGRMRN